MRGAQHLAIEATCKPLAAYSAAMKAFARQLAGILAETKAESKAQYEAELAEIKATLDAELAAEDARWQKKTGETPPRWDTVEELDMVSAWWREKAALAGVPADKLLCDDDELWKMLPGLKPVVFGKLQLLRLQVLTTAATRRRRRPRGDSVRPLTDRQLMAVQVVGECKGNFTEAGRRLGLHRKTVRLHYQAGMRKLAAKTHVRAGRGAPKRQALPESGRGELDLYERDDRSVREGRKLEGKARSSRQKDDD